MSCGTAEQSSHYIASSFIRRKDAVACHEGYGTDVIGDQTDTYILLCIGLIGSTAKCADCITDCLHSVNIKYGINILDNNGTLDLTEEYISRLDIAIAALHPNCCQGGTKAENTAGLLKVIRNPRIQMICHPGDGTAELDFEPLVIAAKETHTVLEINNHSLAPERKRTEARDNNLTLLRLCKQYGTPILLGSDAHVSFQIADYERLWPLIAETAFPDELILNYWPERFFSYLQLPVTPEPADPTALAEN